MKIQLLLLALAGVALWAGFASVHAQAPIPRANQGGQPNGQPNRQPSSQPVPDPNRGPASRVYLGVNSQDLAPAAQNTGTSSSTFQRPAPAAKPATNTVAREAGPLKHQTLKAPISAVVGVRGMETNTIRGYGLVTGLGGTGDSGKLVRKFLSADLMIFGIQISENDLSSKNIAAVEVSAELPAGRAAGQKIDVRVSTIGDATSLEGGDLRFCELLDPRLNEVYGTARGPLIVGGFATAGDSGSSKKNHPTVGYLPGGGKVEAMVPTSVINQHGFVMLDAKNGQATFGNMVAVAEAVNRLYPGAAEVDPNGSSVKVAVPKDLPAAITWPTCSPFSSKRSKPTTCRG